MIRFVQRIAALLVLTCAFAAPAWAQTYSYSVYIDTDNNSATGCTVNFPNGTVSGAESVLTATVTAGSPPSVSAVTQSTCVGGSFGAAVNAGNAAVGVGAGSGGNTAIELTDSLAALVGAGATTLRLYVVAQSATGDDVLLTTSGGGGGGPILLALAGPGQPGAAIPAPFIGIPAAVLLIVILLALGSRAARRRLMKRMLLGLALCSGIAGAAIFNWSGIAPLATDPAGDASSGESAIDLRNFYAALSSANLYFRIDVSGNLAIPVQAPVAVADSYITSLNTALNTPAPGVLGNDTLNTATISAHTNPAHGTLVLNADGSFLYTPTAGYTGSDSFTYTLTNSGGSSNATVSLSVVAGPVAIADSYTTNVGTALNVSASGVLGNDQLGAPAATLTSFGGGSLGGAVTDHAPGSSASLGGVNLTVNADGSVNLAAPTTAGTYTFQYRIGNSQGTSDGTVTIQVNQAPGITSANSATFTVGVSGSFGVTTSGTPAPTIAIGGAALPSGVTFVDNGNGNGTLAGTPGAATAGTYALTFTPTNSVGAGPAQSFTLTVNPAAPTANPVSTSVAFNSTANPIVLNITGGAATSVAVSTAPAHGTTSAVGTSITYTPATGYSGADSFQYTATNVTGTSAPATVTIAVNPAPPVAGAVSATVAFDSTNNPITLNFSGGAPDTVAVTTAAAHGTAVATGTSITYTPTAGYFGADSFQYSGTNAGGTSAPATVSITVSPPSPPIANAVSTTVAFDSTNNPITLNITGGVAASVAVGSAPAHGTAVASGISITYTPTAGYAGPDSFTYTATNAGGTSAPATVTITVNTPAAPIANDVSAAVAINSSANPITLNITGGAPVSVAVSTAPAHGTTSTSGLSITYTPTPGYAGADSFQYTATNLGGTSAPATVSITVNDTPPVVDLNGAASGIDFSATFTEGGAAVAIVDAANLTVTDGDSPNLASATIAISNLLDAGAETLAVSCPDVAPGCSGAIQLADVTYAGATGVLTIASAAPPADYQAVLRTLTYADASQNPTTTTRDITVAVNDGNVDNAPLAHTLVSIVAVNSPPTVSAPATATVSINPATLTFSTANSNAITVADPDAGANPVIVTLTATNGTISALGATAGLAVTGVGSSAVTLTGPLANQNAALNGATFAPAASFSGAATLVVNINDQGYSTGGATQGTPQSASATIAITVDAPPQVTGTTPANNATSVLPTTTVTFTFDKTVNVTASAFKLECPSGTPVAFTLSPAAPGGVTTFTLTPTAALPAGTVCTATAVAAQIKDAANTAMAADFSFSFTVNTLPTVTSTTPASAAANVPPNATITVNFSESVNVTGSAFALACPTGTPIAFTVTPASPATSFVMHPAANLPSGVTCTLTVVAAQVSDVDAGQHMAANFVTTFGTATPPAITSAASVTYIIGTAKTFNVTTTGSPTVTSITQGGTALPAGIAFNYAGGANATLSSTASSLTAAEVGTTSGISFTASNGITPDAVQSNFSVTIQCPLITVSGTLPNGLYQVAYGPQTFTQAGGSAPIAWTATGLQPGLSINSGTGAVSGTPTTTGQSNVTVTATDAFGCTGSTTVSNVKIAPVANGDSYTTVGNTQLVVGAAAPATPYVTGAIALTSNDNGPGALTASVGTVVTTRGGSATINADGSFVFTPKAGDATTDTFTYTLTDGNGITSAPATVSVAISGMVWYVNGTAGAGTGRSSDPFGSLASASTSHVAGDTIFVESGGTATTTPGAISLKANARLWGQGTALPPIGAFTIANTGVTTKPKLTGTVTLAGNGITVSSLDISTGAATGFNNTGTITGATVQNRVSVTTTTGTAVNLSNASGAFTFVSVSANGAANGIALNTTGGSFTVQGDGGTTANASGGTIQNAIGASVLLSAASGVSLNYLNITNSGASGINGTSGTGGATLTYLNVVDVAGGAADDGIHLVNTSGAIVITHSTVVGAPHNGITIDNTGVAATLDFENNAISNLTGANADDGIYVFAHGAATFATASLLSNSFATIFSTAVHVQADNTASFANLAIGAAGLGNTFSNNGIGIDIDQSATASITFGVLNNTFNGHKSQNINVFSNDTLSTGGTVTGQIENNTIGTKTTLDSGSAIGDGIRAAMDGGVHTVLTITGNTISEVPNGRGIDVTGAHGAGGGGGLNVKVANNVVNRPTAPGTAGNACGVGAGVPCPLASIFVSADNFVASGTSTVCSLVSGNTAYDPTSYANGGEAAFYLQQNTFTGAATHNLGGTQANATAQISTTNTITNSTASPIFIDGTVNIVPVANCGTFPP